MYATLHHIFIFPGGKAHLLRVAPAFLRLLLPSQGCSCHNKKIYLKWNGMKIKGPRHATLWSISCLFNFRNFFGQNFEKNKFQNSWRTFEGFSTPKLFKNCLKWVLVTFDVKGCLLMNLWCDKVFFSAKRYLKGTPFHFFNVHHKFGNSFFSKFWHVNQKSFWSKNRQLIDHRVAWCGPFFRFLFHFGDRSFFYNDRSNPVKEGATPGRLEQPSEGVPYVMI